MAFSHNKLWRLLAENSQRVTVSRARFKLALRYVKRHENQLRSVCGLFVACSWLAYDITMACLLPVCGLFVGILWPVIDLDVEFIFPVSGVSIACS